MQSNYRAHLIQDGRETANGELAALWTTRNFGTSSRPVVIRGFAAGHILRDLERREVASDAVFPWSLFQPVQQLFSAVARQDSVKSFERQHQHFRFVFLGTGSS